MRIVWTPRAQRDLDAVFDYIVQHNPTAARSMSRRIRERVHRLWRSTRGPAGRGGSQARASW